MLTALLLTILPTLLVYVLLSKTNFKINSSYIKISLCWFTGQYIFTILTFLLAILLSYFTSSVLYRASLIMLLLVGDALIFFHKDITRLSKEAFFHKKITTLISPTNIILVGSCLLFSFFLFRPQLDYVNGSIYRSPIYWDFHWHAALIQNFTLGDNFPPQNEAFAGVPHTYHFFWAILVGVYTTLGLSIIDAINLFSIITFFFILITLIGLSEEFFGTKYPGIIAVILSITSSSLHFIDYFGSIHNQNVLQIFTNIFNTTQHPWYASFVPAGHSFYYNGTFFNLFYFIEERQLILGVLYLLLSLFLLNERKKFSGNALLLIGTLMGGYFLWHIHLTITVLCALLFLLIFDRDRKKTFLMLTGFTIVFIAHVAYFKLTTQSLWFVTSAQSFPKINLGFSDQENKPFSFLHAYNWYLYSYGLKLILLPISLSAIRIKNKKLFLLICSVVVPTFVILNTIQLSPGSVYENHKWLRPMNFVIDLAVAYVVYKMFFTKKNVLIFISGLLVIFFLTISGIIELMPFINSKPTERFASYPSTMSQAIKINSKPKESFIGFDNDEIQLVGRKMFLGDILGGGLGLDKERRQKIIDAIYLSSDIKKFCSLNKHYGIGYIESGSSRFISDQLQSLDYFPATNNKGEQVKFIDIKKTCRTYKDI